MKSLYLQYSSIDYLPSPGGGGSVTKLCSTLGSPWTVALQAPLSMGFPRQEHWSGLPFPSLGDLIDLWSNPHFLNWRADFLLLSHQRSLLFALTTIYFVALYMYLQEKKEKDASVISSLRTDKEETVLRYSEATIFKLLHHAGWAGSM